LKAQWGVLGASQSEARVCVCAWMCEIGVFPGLGQLAAEQGEGWMGRQRPRLGEKVGGKGVSERGWVRS
jgi:hypothetical protein